MLVFKIWLFWTHLRLHALLSSNQCISLEEGNNISNLEFHLFSLTLEQKTLLFFFVIEDDSTTTCMCKYTGVFYSCRSGKKNNGMNNVIVILRKITVNYQHLLGMGLDNLKTSRFLLVVSLHFFWICLLATQFKFHLFLSLILLSTNRHNRHFKMPSLFLV